MAIKRNYFFHIFFSTALFFISSPADGLQKRRMEVSENNTTSRESQQTLDKPDLPSSLAIPSGSAQVTEASIPSQNSSQQTLDKPDLPSSSDAFALKAMPIGSQLIALRSISPERNPFTSINFNELDGPRNLPRTISLRGILKVGNSLGALIRTSNGEQIFEIGQQIENGYKIDNIYQDDQRINLSNGSRKYTLRMNQ